MLCILDDEKKFEIGRDRDDTPDSLISTSSPDMSMCDTPVHFPGICLSLFFFYYSKM